VKSLTISESEAQKILDAAFQEAIDARKYETLLPTDWTIERLAKSGMSKRQAARLIDEMIDKGVAVAIRYKKNNGYVAKGCRAKNNV